MTGAAAGAGQHDIDIVLSELRRRLLRYRADRRPVEHATTQFHLGATLLQVGRLAEAAHALTTAAELFDAHARPVERAKAENLLGAALREGGDHVAALAAFERAGSTFAEHQLPTEEGATRFNVGLARRDAGDEHGAAVCFAQALDRFTDADVPAQASAAARELGASRLATGAFDTALDALELAEALADRAGDHVGLGAAANVRGLALLGAGRPEAAVRAFERAAGANPRRLRPEAYAMAKANLALAFERAGSPHGARLAARQSSASPAAAPAVRTQAQQVLDRLGADPDDLHRLLDDEREERWLALLRDELARWSADTDEARARDAGGWIDGLLARPASAEQRAWAWLEVLLEQPPTVLERVARSTVTALTERDADAQERFRAPVRRAMARFGVPQLVRLERTFGRLAAEAGTAWS